MEELNELFPNLTDAEKLQVFPLFSNEAQSFLYQGTPAQQFAGHIDAMMMLTSKMRGHVEEQMERDKNSLEKILQEKIDHHKAYLEYEQKRDKWEWTKNVLDALSLTITGFSALTTLYAYSTMGPAAPSALYALEAAFGAVCGTAALIMRAKKPEEVRASMALSAMSLVVSMHMWYANVAIYQHLLGPELAGIKKQVEFFSDGLLNSIGCLTGFKAASGAKMLKIEAAKGIISNQKFQKKGEALGEGVAKHTIADKHFAGFIKVASAALSQLSEITKKSNRGG